MQMLKKQMNNTKEKNRLNKGITLIALAVTVVLLLILAGVTINLLFGERGIIKSAQEAAEQTNEAIKREEAEYIKGFEEYIDSVVRGDTQAEGGPVPASLDE